MSTPVYVDVGALAIVTLFVLLGSWFIWGRWLSRLPPRCQTAMDILAVALSALIVFSMATGWLLQFLG